jgi:chromosome segregation ATPase
MDAIAKLEGAIAEAKTKCAHYSAEVERLTKADKEEAADKAQEHLDEWDSWLSDLESQLETIQIDTAEILAQRPKAA